MAEKIEGIRLPETEEWIGKHTDRVVPPFEWTRLTGGTSNLTYLIRDGEGRRAVVRRPPTGKLLPKAHDMEREYKILEGLAPTAVPIALPYAVCRDPEVTGAPFYVMEFCDAEAPSVPFGALRDWPISVRPGIGLSMVDALAELHALEPADVGLADLGRSEGYVARQLNRWFDSWQRSHEAAKIEVPGLIMSFETLSRHVPDQGSARVCHGDYAPHNLLITDDGTVRAIMDWEISTLGDPLADFTYFLGSWGPRTSLLESADAFLDERPDKGHASRRELVAHYERRTGRTASNLWFYLAFNKFKSACITQGVYARFRGGVRGTQGADVEAMREAVFVMANAAKRMIGFAGLD
jgi:aminoglycoside phosphotransferase (APT) family kinase protein